MNPAGDRGGFLLKLRLRHIRECPAVFAKLAEVVDDFEIVVRCSVGLDEFLNQPVDSFDDAVLLARVQPRQVLHEVHRHGLAGHSQLRKPFAGFHHRLAGRSIGRDSPHIPIDFSKGHAVRGFEILPPLRVPKPQVAIREQRHIARVVVSELPCHAAYGLHRHRDERCLREGFHPPTLLASRRELRGQPLKQERLRIHTRDGSERFVRLAG